MAEFPTGQDIAVLGPSLLVKDRTNKTAYGTDWQEDIESDHVNELDLDLDDAELLELDTKWRGQYQAYEGKINLKRRQKMNKQYSIGRQGDTGSSLESKTVPSNILFEARETYLAQALAKSPDPLVWADNTPQGNELSKDVKTQLQYLADVLNFRRKLAMMVRHWDTYFIGALKHGWDQELQEITCDLRHPQNLMLDPQGYVDPSGDFIGWVGDKVMVTASKLAELFPEWEAYIADAVSYKMGTEVSYTEWWTDDFTFTVFQKRVLDKSRNPHFNYPKKIKENKADRVVQVLKAGKNHFAKPMKPYTFLSVFSYQEQPHDETSVIEQNIANQDFIVESIKQIGRNFRLSNNAWVFSLDHYDQQTAKQALTAFEDGTGALCRGDVDKAVKRIDAASYPPEAFQFLQMNMETLRSVYGTIGLSSQKPQADITARGQILNQQHDSTRIGGGIGDALEAVAKNTFNQQVQFMYKYYDEKHVASILGGLGAIEETMLQDSSFDRKLTVSVADDSMSPKDEISESNQALSLWGEKAIDIKSLLTILNIPNAEDVAAQTWLQQTNPQLYGEMNFQQLFQKLQQMQPPQPQQQPGAPQPGAVPSPMQPQQPPTAAAPPASAALANVPLPKT